METKRELYQTLHDTLLACRIHPGEAPWLERLTVTLAAFHGAVKRAHRRPARRTLEQALQ